MGLLTDYIKQQHQKELQARDAKIAAYSHILSDPLAPTEGREYAFDQIMGMGKMKGKQHEGLGGMFKKLLGLGGGQEQAQKPIDNAPAVGARDYQTPSASSRTPQIMGPYSPAGRDMLDRFQVPPLPDAGGGQPQAQAKAPQLPQVRPRMVTPQREADERKYRNFEREETLKHQYAMEEKLQQAHARGDRAIGSPQNLMGPDGKPHKYQTFMGQDGTTYQLDLGETAATQGNLTKQWVQRPGASEPELAFVNPKNPRGYISAEGEELPDGTKSVATPTQERLYGAVQGYYYAAKARGLSDADAKKEAGLMFEKVQGAHLSRLQQQQAVEQALSGIGGGAGFGLPTKVPPVPLPGAPTTTPEATPATAKPPVDRTVVPPVPGTTTPSRPAPARGTSPVGMNQKESDDVLLYLSHNITGTLGTNRSAAVREQSGLKALAKMTGLNPLELSAALAENKAGVKQLAETVQRAGAIQRLNNTIDAHGTILENVAKGVKDTGSPLFNQPVREWKRKMVGSPELKRFEMAQNAVQREYAYLTAGGAQSRAMLPVSTVQNMEHMMSADATMAEVLASVDQIRKEAKAETEAMEKTKSDIREQLTGGAIGAAVGGRRDKVSEVPGGAPKVKTWNPKTGKFE